jgi:hypothetical protein
MRSLHLKSILNMAGGGLLLISILPFLLLSNYIQPQSDDFAVDAVLKAHGLIDAQIEWYLSWTGRYFAHLMVSIIHPLRYGHPEGIGIIAFIWILLFTFSVWYFVRSFTSIGKSLFPTGLLIAVYCWQIPSPGEAFYWIPSTMSYQLGITLQLLFFGLLNRESISPYRRFLLVLLAILIPGTSEINLLIFLFVLFGIIAFRMILRKQISRLFLWLFFAAIIMSLFSLMSPGNSGRAQMIAQNAEATPIQNLPFAIREGLALAKSELLFHFTRSPLLLFTLLLVLIRSSFAILRNIEPKGWMVLLFWLSALSIYVFLHIPYIYQTGILHIPGRVSNVIHLYFLIAWSSGILLTSSYLLGHYDFEDKGLILTTTGIILSYCMLQLTIPNKIEHAWMDKLTGKAAAYDAAQNERIRFMQSAVGQSVIVSPLSVKPSSIFLVDLEMDPVDWKNQAYAKYYGLKSIQLGDSNKVILP